MRIFKIKSKIFTLAILGLVSGVFSFYQSFISNVFAEETQFNISLEPAIEMIIPASVELPITPNPSGTMESTSFDILVGTNNITGYTLTMTNSSTELINSTASATISTLEDDTLKANFPTNRWGYSLDDITYNPIITSSTTLKTTDTNGNATPIAINLATKVNLEKPAGSYTNIINFAAVANAIPFVPPISTMQEMTPEICQEFPLEEQVQLKDSRDNTTYTVSRLKDGNCWMTENLAIAGTTINAEDSDFTSGTFTLPNEIWDGDSIDYATPGAYTKNGETYYNWDAATAGTGRGMSIFNTDAPGSICPKGWKLPRSGDYQGSGSFYGLWSQYMPDIDSYSWSSDPADPSVAPLSLVFPGYFDPLGGEVINVGDFGFWWSSTVIAFDYAFCGYVDSYGGVRPTYIGSGGRLVGNSVRCLSPGA